MDVSEDWLSINLKNGYFSDVRVHEPQEETMFPLSANYCPETPFGFPLESSPLHWNPSAWNLVDWGDILDSGPQPRSQADNGIVCPPSALEIDITTSSTKDQIDELFQPVIGTDEPSRFTFLKSWVEDHPNLWYPDSVTKDCLSELTGLSLKQISTWFSNYRQRIVKTDLQSHPGEEPRCIEGYQLADAAESPFHNSGSLPSTGHRSSYKVNAPSSLRSPSSVNDNLGGDGELQTQNTRLFDIAKIGDLYNKGGSNFTTIWISQLDAVESFEQATHMSSYDEECSPTREYKESYRNQDGNWSGSRWEMGPDVTAQEMVNRYKCRPRRKRSRNSSTRASDRRHELGYDRRFPPTTNSLERTNYDWFFPPAQSPACIQSDADGASASSASGGQKSSANSYTSLGSRRGRRMHTGYPPPSSASPMGKRFKCDSCSKSFTRNTTLSRHLNAVHTGSESWLCMPTKYVQQIDNYRHSTYITRRPQCLCGMPYAIKCEHRMSECWSKSEDQRTFYRLDAFKRHLRETHGLGPVVETLTLKEFEIRKGD